MADASRKLAERSEALVENAAQFQVLQTTMEQNRETIGSLSIERESVKVELAKLPDHEITGSSLREEKASLSANRGELEGGL